MFSRLPDFTPRSHQIWLEIALRANDRLTLVESVDRSLTEAKRTLGCRNARQPVVRRVKVVFARATHLSFFKASNRSIFTRASCTWSAAACTNA